MVTQWCQERNALGLHREETTGFPMLGIFLNSALFTFPWQFFKINLFNWRLITLQYCSGFCHTLTWIHHGCTHVPHPEASSHLAPHPIPQGHPSAPALRALSHTSNRDWRSISHMVIYMFQCHSLKSSHPRLLPESKSLFFTSVSLLLSCIQGYCSHFSKFHTVQGIQSFNI